MKKSSIENICLGKIIEKFKVYSVDFMGFSINNNLTYHHIIPKSKNGETTVENGAALTSISHAYLHEIERKNFITYRQINNMFKALHKTNLPPDQKYYEQIKYLMNKYELKKERILKK